MGWFIAACISGCLAVLVGIIAFAVKVPEDEYNSDEIGLGKKVAKVIAGVLLVVGAACLGFGSFYAQDPGEGVVLRSISRDVVGQTYESGFHAKAPWVETNRWDIRDNTISYVAEGSTDYNGGSATGPRITVQDRDGVDADIDLTLRYSIEGDEVANLYSRFGSQEDVITKVIEPGIRSAMREVPVSYSTLELLNKRADIQERVKERLTGEFGELGIIVEDVDIQEIVQPEQIKQANAEKAAAEAQVEREYSLLEQAKVEAQKNAAKSKELSPEILQQQYIEAIAKSGFVVIAPEGVTPMLQLPQK